jgi:alpha-beta hydrolase superfamily lysophospholipase
MRSSSFTLIASDGVALGISLWLPESQPKAVVQIAHGLAEHAGRYARLAAALTADGWAVYASDHRGHGRTAPAPEDLGFFAAAQGWRKCLDDLWRVNRRIAADFPGVPIVLLGHSMGSIMAQHFIAEHGDVLAGVILSGASGKPSPLALAGRLVARLERIRLGARGRSAFLHALSFGAFNKAFAPARTSFDWLSRDAVEVDKYCADPLCGFRASTQLWIDLLDAVGEASGRSRLRRIPKHLPIHVIAGGSDPVSAGTKTLEPLLTAYRAAGLERVTHRFYDNARHELFNETNREEVTRDLIAWLDNVMPVTAPREASQEKVPRRGGSLA